MLTKASEIILYIILLILWIYILSIFKRNKLTAFYFMLGSAGMFCFTFLAFKDILTKICSVILLNILGLLQHIFRFYIVYKEYYILFIESKESSISMLIDYECCGVIEILVVLSIICFFPVFTVKEKIVNSVIGFVYTMIANIIRLISVSYIIYLNGSNSYYLAHAVIGRVIFYVLILFLYFYLLSFSQIKGQKIGNFEYGG